MKIQITMIVETTNDTFKEEDEGLLEEDNVALYIESIVDGSEGLEVSNVEGVEED